MKFSIFQMRSYILKKSLREKCPNKEFFWSVFSCIRTEHEDLRIQSEYRKMRVRNHSLFGHFSRSESLIENFIFCAVSLEHSLTSRLIASLNTTDNIRIRRIWPYSLTIHVLLYIALYGIKFFYFLGILIIS